MPTILDTRPPHPLATHARFTTVRHHRRRRSDDEQKPSRSRASDALAQPGRYGSALEAARTQAIASLALPDTAPRHRPQALFSPYDVAVDGAAFAVIPEKIQALAHLDGAAPGHQGDAMLVARDP